MFFSEKYNLNPKILEKHGAVDISLICDRPLFVDPLLIFQSKKEEYKKLHAQIIKYLYFLAKKSQNNDLTEDDIKTWFSFNEVKNNWLGYCLSGNAGQGLDTKFGTFLYRNVGKILEDHSVTKDKHLEKIMLFYKKTGKDKISDFTVNIIKEYLASYTQAFAHKFLKSTDYEKFFVEKVRFNYANETFESISYDLPFVINKKNKKEYVLLTPIDILREDDQAINYSDMIRNQDKVRLSLPNGTLKTQVENYISIAVKKYEKEQIQTQKKKKKIKINYAKLTDQAFVDALNEFPILYDYYIKFKEENFDEDLKVISNELKRNQSFFYENAKILTKLLIENYKPVIKTNSRDEAIYRIIEFKRIIEKCGGYKSLYNEDGSRRNETEVHRLFKLAFVGSKFLCDSEVNNGNGSVDFKVSMGADDSQLIEFKLASNSKLSHVFNQTNEYDAANAPTFNSLVVIMYFSATEKNKVLDMLRSKNKDKEINKTVFLVDCCDNKVSASRA